MQLFPLVLNLAGLSPLFTAFAAVNCAGALAVYHMVPETCGRSLEEVEQLWQACVSRVETGVKQFEICSKLVMFSNKYVFVWLFCFRFFER